MTEAGLWECIQAAGIKLTAEGAAIRAEPRQALTDALRNGIRANRAAILARLEHELLELLDLVERVAAYYRTPPDEVAEMKRLALADPVAARQCFTAELRAFEGGETW